MPVAVSRKEHRAKLRLCASQERSAIMLDDLVNSASLAGSVVPIARKAPVAVIVPTYDRGGAVISVLERVLACDPQPAEIWVHIDRSDGVLESDLNERFPGVRVLTSAERL